MIMKKMSIAREIKIQRLQTKNRMTGQTFNPSGHTSESLKQREIDEVKRLKELPPVEFEEYKKGIQDVQRHKLDNNLHFSNSFETNVFLRNF